MHDQKDQLREVAIEAISDIAQHLPLDCQMFVVVCRPGKDDFDLVLPSPEANLNNALDALRRQGLSIDGDNAYKRDLCDSIVGAMAFGAQDRNPPPAGHWGQRFWDIGREERTQQEELLRAARKALDGLNARIDEASTGGSPVPIFEGIAELHDAIAKATQ